MKALSPILILSLFVCIVGCQPDEIEINTGPLFPGTFMMEGTHADTGEPVSGELAQNATGVPIDAVITINFSKAVSADAASAVSFTQEGTAVDATVSVEGQSIVVDPAAELAYGTRYTLTVDNSIRAEDGGVLLGELTRAFTTATLAPTIYDGLIFYMPFDGNYTETISGDAATVVGTPGFAGEAVEGTDAYAGAADSYLTFPTEGLQSETFSASFWLKINAVPDRAGILVMGPPDPNAPDKPNNRTAGFRFFREAAGAMQRFKLNVGNGTADTWFDGGIEADVDPTTNDWVHFAFTISPTEGVVYIDGEVVKQAAFTGVSWAGCDILSIMSGAPRFTGFNHFSDQSYMDELRIFNKVLTQENIAAIIQAESGYEGQTLFMPFDGTYKDVISNADATIVGTPGFAGEAIEGSDSYAGAADSYLTFPTDGLLGEEFSAAFWLKINAVPDRAGILVIGPPDQVAPDKPNNRTAGFRFFREAAGAMQRFKLNVGNGTADTWFDGGVDADVDPTTTDWVHFAFTISPTEAVVYIDGEVVKQGPFTGVSWEGCDILSIMSGAPRFTGFNHFSDLSYMDELRLFNRALTQAEIQTIMNE